MAAEADRQTIAWLHRRAGWGLGPGELDARATDGVQATIDRLVDPDHHGVPKSPDPWANADLEVPNVRESDSSAAHKQARDHLRREGESAIEAWLDQLIATPRPLVDWMAWFWHGHFVSGLDKVRLPLLMVQQLRTYRSLALAPFPELVRAATTDAAMLVYLDGATSTGDQPNENYGRELLELFTLGLGNYTEDDVQAGARALTGWTVPRLGGQPELRSRSARRCPPDVPRCVRCAQRRHRRRRGRRPPAVRAVHRGKAGEGDPRSDGRHRAGQPVRDGVRGQRSRHARPRAFHSRSGRRGQGRRGGQSTGAVAGGGAAGDAGEAVGRGAAAGPTGCRSTALLSTQRRRLADRHDMVRRIDGRRPVRPGRQPGERRAPKQSRAVRGAHLRPRRSRRRPRTP